MIAKLRKGVIGTLTGCLLLSGNPMLTRVAVAEPVTIGVAVVSTGWFLFQWLAGHALDEATGIRGTVDTRQLRTELAQLARTDREHADVLLQLQAALDDKMSRNDVESLLREALGKVDERLAKLEQEVARHERELESHAQSLGLHDAELIQLRQQQATHYTELAGRLSQHSTRLDGHDRDVTRLSGTMSRHGARLDRHDADVARLNGESNRHASRLEGHDQGLNHLTDEIVELRRDYPRIDPERQGAQLAASGATALQRGDWNEARRSFQLGQAINPHDPALAYGLAVTLRHQGQTVEADAALARAIVLERTQGLGQRPWFLADRFQGTDRQWIESARRDPVFGVYTPGDLGTVAFDDPSSQSSLSPTKESADVRLGSRSRVSAGFDRHPHTGELRASHR